MKRIRDTFMLWVAACRMGSEELAALTLPSWMLTALHFRNEVRRDYIGLVAAGVAFYFLLAAFPALAAAVSIFGLFADPHVITAQLASAARLLPPQAFEILVGQAGALAGVTDRHLSIGFVVSTLLALYSASRGTAALMNGFNIAYNVEERRGFMRHTLVSHGLTLLLLAHVVVSLMLVAILPALVSYLPLPEAAADALRTLRWPVLFVAAVAGLEILYTYGPCRKRRRLRLSPGSVVATLLWTGGSALFSLFVSSFAQFNETYGSLAAVVVLISWFWLSALSVLIGAEINGALEARSERKG